MGRTTMLLMALALALIAVAHAAPPALRKSRFLADKTPPPLSYYDCVRKPPSVCLEPGSPGNTCCKGTCTNTLSSVEHCGNCNRKCKYGDTCCDGKCVDLLKDKKNCGECSNQCAKSVKCEFGMCDYAG
ncbi:hypothetical protein CFC21_046855 [Triticum aestivum]|uniref:Stigma-specific STIG1-like protein 1 n=2 Tax=Triticum aestivum TaxID=4565 RepID=A0A3B6GR08_WHEAT|nr:stigma-specific STIG1-like protein 4 [Triticum aestivum]KAF7036101.1 hypothetical protein CFC21_046855 [Triticum aestivum]